MKNPLLIIAIAATVFASCKKDPEPEVLNPTPTTDIRKSILADFTTNIAQGAYNELAARTLDMHANALVLQSSTTDMNLATCKQNWKDARMTWEKTEAFLFGPVSTENIDPRIDTWPVNFVDLDGQLAGSAEFTQDYINTLQDPLKGFHPIEYLLFGQNGNKTADQLTARELEYLVALTQNVKTLTSDLSTVWNPSTSDNYSSKVSTAGEGSSVYTTRVEAFEELVNAMAGICDEVANGKIAEPFISGDPSLEESPFASNSIIDFTNNIKGVEVVYLGKYNANGYGLEDLVRENNLSLDGEIKTKLAAAISSLENIAMPFSQAMVEQPGQVQTAINAINALKVVLEEELLPYVQIHAN